MLAIIIVAVVLAKFQSAFFYFTLIWILLCIVIITTNLTLFDINISGDILVLKRILSQKRLNINDLKIYNVAIRRHPLFFLETSAGNLNVNYTNQNYQQMLELLRKTGFSGFEVFESKVKKYIINIRKR
jgi:hypothetical protein